MTEEDLAKKLNNTLTETERREYTHLQEQTSRMWRNFWIRIAKTRGYSNVQIAQEFNLSEGTVRGILKK